MLVSGRTGYAAPLFVNNSNGQIGAMGKWDAVCFDESTDELFKDREVVPLMKDYMERDHSCVPGKSGEKSANASIILNGNINQPVETVLQTSHLFSPFSDKISDDTAFLDRIGFFLPGWEIMKFAPANFTNHIGFSTDFFSEMLHHLRKDNYTNALDDYFTLGSQLRQRDTKPVRKTVSALIKLMHPDGNFTKEDIRKYLSWAIEMRRRVGALLDALLKGTVEAHRWHGVLGYQFLLYRQGDPGGNLCFRAGGTWQQPDRRCTFGSRHLLYGNLRWRQGIAD